MEKMSPFARPPSTACLLSFPKDVRDEEEDGDDDAPLYLQDRQILKRKKRQTNEGKKHNGKEGKIQSRRRDSSS